MIDDTQQLIQAFYTQIERVFVYYCSFGDKDSYASLKIQNFQRFLTDLQLKGHSSLVPQFDVIFYSYAQAKALDIKRFITVLGDVAGLAFGGLEKQKRLEKLLKIHLQPLYDLVLGQTDFGQNLVFISATLFKQNCFGFLKKFQEGLLLLYCNYFSKQGKSGEQEQLKIMYKLSRQLNIIQRIVNKPLIYLIYNFLRQKSSKSVFHILFANSVAQTNKAYKFDFVCFMEYLIILSHIRCKGQQNQIIKIYKLLELIQVSLGCQNLTKKHKFQHFYLTEKQLQESKTVKIFQTPYRNHKNSIRQTTRSTSATPLKRKLGNLYDLLKTKFVKLCIKKHVQTNFYLPFPASKKLITKICPSLTGMTIELMINAAGRLNFQNFITLLDSIAKRVDVKPQLLYEQVLLYNTDRYSVNLILENIKLLPQEEITCHQILKFSQPYTRSIYEYFETGGSLSLTNYCKLLQQTAVVPKLVDISEATDVYRVSVAREDRMTFEEFQATLKGIIVCVHFEYGLEGIERLIFLLEKICESKRGEILMKKNLLMVKEHPLYKLRLAYNQVYKSIQRKLKQNNQRSPSKEKASSKGKSLQII